MLRILGRQIIASLGDRAFNFLSYHYLHARHGEPAPRLEFSEPRVFNHKIIWLKMHYRHPLARTLADKLAVKMFAEGIIGQRVIIPTLKVFRRGEPIDFSELPDQFMAKATHGSGWSVIVRDKNSLDQKTVVKRLQRWLSLNYYSLSREHQYRDIPPAIIVEPLLESVAGRGLMDFKFFCFHGEPRLVQVDVDRFINHARNFYDMSWSPLDFSLLYPQAAEPVRKPACFDEMVAIARRLSSGFPFLRVDLYEHDGKPLLGELTLHPEGGFGPITPSGWDRRLGDMLRLPDRSDPLVII